MSDYNYRSGEMEVLSEYAGDITGIGGILLLW
jgi:hypothetical protein